MLRLLLKPAETAFNQVAEHPLRSLVIIVCTFLFALIVVVNLFGPDRVGGWIERQLGMLPTVAEQPLMEGTTK